MHTPTQAQLLARSRDEATIARKRRYQRVVGIGLGGAGIAAAIGGLPLSVSIGFWVFGAISWAILKAV